MEELEISDMKFLPCVKSRFVVPGRVTYNQVKFLLYFIIFIFIVLYWFYKLFDIYITLTVIIFLFFLEWFSKTAWLCKSSRFVSMICRLVLWFEKNCLLNLFIVYEHQNKSKKRLQYSIQWVIIKRELPRIATDCYRLPRIPTDCHGLLRIATDCHGMPPDCHGLPINCLDKLRIASKLPQ